MWQRGECTKAGFDLLPQEVIVQNIFSAFSYGELLILAEVSQEWYAWSRSVIDITSNAAGIKHNQEYLLRLIIKKQNQNQQSWIRCFILAQRLLINYPLLGTRFAPMIGCGRISTWRNGTERNKQLIQAIQNKHFKHYNLLRQLLEFSRGISERPLWTHLLYP